MQAELRRPCRACTFSTPTQICGRFATSTLGFAVPLFQHLALIIPNWKLHIALNQESGINFVHARLHRFATKPFEKCGLTASAHA